MGELGAVGGFEPAAVVAFVGLVGFFAEELAEALGDLLTGGGHGGGAVILGEGGVGAEGTEVFIGGALDVVNLRGTLGGQVEVGGDFDGGLIAGVKAALVFGEALGAEKLKEAEVFGDLPLGF